MKYLVKNTDTEQLTAIFLFLINKNFRFHRDSSTDDSSTDDSKSPGFRLMSERDSNIESLVKEYSYWEYLIIDIEQKQVSARHDIHPVLSVITLTEFFSKDFWSKFEPIRLFDNKVIIRNKNEVDFAAGNYTFNEIETIYLKMKSLNS